MSAVKNISLAYDEGNEVLMAHQIKIIRSWSLATAVLGMMVCMLLSPLLNKWSFSWGNHTLHYILLSPVVALSAITGGEAAILKGLRRLRSLAVISLLNVVLALGRNGYCAVSDYHCAVTMRAYHWLFMAFVPSTNTVIGSSITRGQPDDTSGYSFCNRRYVWKWQRFRHTLIP